MVGFGALESDRLAERVVVAACSRWLIDLLIRSSIRRGRRRDTIDFDRRSFVS